MHFQQYFIYFVAGPKYLDATTELELVNNKINHSWIEYTSLQVT